MDPSFIIMWFGFILAGYSVVGNDSIQTLGTFLSSNEQRPWYVLWLFAGSILAATLIYGWYSAGDVSYGRLEKYPFIEDMGWTFLLPPIVLLLLTRTGIPVSTSFLILTFFKPKGLISMTMKSLLGYVLAFALAILVWQAITRLFDKRFIENPMNDKERRNWTILQWCSTGFLWSMWLIQDFANIYVYLPRAIGGMELFVSLSILLSLLAYIFYSRGGAIQEIVKAKTNTVDIRSATLIDFLYALILLFFKELSNVPMSTTWVFLGLLGGRELAIRYQLGAPLVEKVTSSWKNVGIALNVAVGGFVIYVVGSAMYQKFAQELDKVNVSNGLILAFAAVIISRVFVLFKETETREQPLNKTLRMVGTDLGKVTFGLVISIVLSVIMMWLTGNEINFG